jgi:Protein of unknown function (DUF4199)
MRKTIVKFGLISGAVSSAMMLVTVTFTDRIGFDRGLYLGYTGIVLSFLLVYFGVRSYRDDVGGGQITFGKAFVVGLGITLISCMCYVMMWEPLYFTVMHDHLDKYGTYMVQKERSAGASEAVIQQKMQEMAHMKQMLENPFINAAMTFIEPFPVGLVMTLISAGLLRKKKSGEQVVAVGV